MTSKTTSVTVGHCISWTTPNSHDSKSNFFTIKKWKCHLRFCTGQSYGSDYRLYLYSESKPDKPLDLSVQLVIGTDTVSYSRVTFGSTSEMIIWKGCFWSAPQIGPDCDQHEFTFHVIVHDSTTTGHKLGEKSTKADLILVEPDLDSLSSDLITLLYNEVNNDVRLNCKDGFVLAHRLILSARSKVFATMFQTDMAEKETGEVNVQQMDCQTTRLFLKFLYSGKVPQLPGKMASNLYVLGDKYDVPSLKRMCSNFMAKNVSEETYIDYLLLADTHGDENFKRSLVCYVIKNPELMRNEKWLTFSAEHMKLALEVLQTHMLNV